MFKATEDLERKAAEEREEIRRKLRQDEEEAEQRAGNFNSDFEVLPEEHPLMQAKAAALRAASSSASSSSAAASDLSNVSSDDELAKLDELLAAKAKAEATSAAAKKLGTVPEELSPAAASARPAQPQQGQWAGLMAKPAVISPSDSSSAASAGAGAGTSKFASRFGFGLQDEAADPWASPPSAAPAAALVAGGAPKSSQWGFSLEDQQPSSSSSACSAAAAAFAATPNTIQPRSQPPLHIQQQQQAHYMQHAAPAPQPEYRQIDLARMFEQAGSSSSGAALPSMPAHSGVALATPPPQAAPTPMVEDSLQRLLSKQKNRKQGGGPSGPAVPTSMLHSQTQQILPAHLLGQTAQHAAQQSAYAPYPASSIPPPQPQVQAPAPSASLPQPSAALLTNPTFLSLPPHQQQQYLRHWQEQQQRGTVAPQQQPQQQQPQRIQPPHQQHQHQQSQGQYHPQQPLPSHYAPVPQQRVGPTGYPAPSNLPPHQQQQGQGQPRNPMHQPHGLIPSNYPQQQQSAPLPQQSQSNLPPHQQMYQQQPLSSSQQHPQQHGMMHGGRMPPNHGQFFSLLQHSTARQHATLLSRLFVRASE